MSGEEWICTFGQGQEHAGCCVRIKGTYIEAREKMFGAFGNKWAFQYPAADWDKWKTDPARCWIMEKEIPFPEPVEQCTENGGGVNNGGCY